MGLSDMSRVTLPVVGKIMGNSSTSWSFHHEDFCLFGWIHISGEAAIHAPFELQTHHKATVYFAMEFNNLATYY